MPTHRFGTVLAALAVGGLGAVMMAGPVSAETTSPTSVLRLSTSAAESENSSSSWARGATLECGPPGGTHPAAEEACRVLTDAGGDFESIPARGGACTMEHAPVRVTAYGYWEGSQVTFDETYSNPCHATSATGGVFDF